MDRVAGLDAVNAEIGVLRTPVGDGRVELANFHSPAARSGGRRAPPNELDIRHVAFVVDDIDAVVAGLRSGGAQLIGDLQQYENVYRLCYVRGPEGIIAELTEQIG